MKALAALSFVVAACSPGAPTSKPGTTPDAGSGGSSDPNAPKILALHTNLMTMTAGEQLVVSAVVTDPDGIDDLIGGNLTTVDGTSAYGAFVTDAGEGAYSISLTWDAINQTYPIEAPAGGTTARGFRAAFFDVAGHTVYRDVTVNLGCAGNNAACDGSCVPLDTTTNCGACGQSCMAVCEAIGDSHACAVPTHSDTRVACSSLCTAPLGACLEEVAVYGDLGDRVDLSCAAVPPATHGNNGFVYVGCWCAEP